MGLTVTRRAPGALIVPADAHEAAVWAAIERGHTATTMAAARRLRSAARRALRDYGSVGEFRVLAACAALQPWMLAEAEDLRADLALIRAPKVTAALAGFLASHRAQAARLA
jgi:hypothetical protein